ncbi:MAG: type II toxin-antitoxin system mRNA interferase toxin, RelE/StbE family [Candidatus Azambacteria bacterium]|nr:type II toxin-antitoxin system mRNA interferase toxin, RelE/StbE family [Candidatus Azambacteria bacterium]
MDVIFHRNFKRHYKKLRISEQKKCDEKIVLFMENPLDPLLHNHALGGKWGCYRSINITGDPRALYEPIGIDTALFILVNTHSNLYK